MIDVIVIGGGPAGMSAALVAGRGKKQVLLIDEERPRNRVTHESHAFLTRDKVKPSIFREKGRRDLLRYPTISIEQDRVESINNLQDETFEVHLSSGKTVQARYVVLAIGVRENLPNVPGIEQYYGQSIFSCPFCDGWEMKDRPLILIAENQHALHVATLLKNWTEDLIIATNGHQIFDEEAMHQLKTNHIEVIEERIAELNGTEGQLEDIRFDSGRILERSGGFCTTEIISNHPFIDQLRLEVNESGFVVADMLGRTNIKGLYAAGEITGPSQLIVSASQGHMAGAGIISNDSQAAFAKGDQ